MSEEIENGTALVVVENLNPIAVFGTEGGAKTVIDSIKDQVSKLDLDISTEAGRKKIKSVVRTLGTKKRELDDAGKFLKAEMQKTVDLVDGERKEIRDAIEELQEEIKKPLVEFENRENLRIQLREERITQLYNLRTPLIPDPDVETIQAHLDQLKETEQFDWQEFVMRAEATAKESRDILEAMKTRRIKHDEDQAELERLRKAEEARLQKEREDEIAAKAKKDAEDIAAEEARVAKEKADKEIAEEKARADKAEADRVEAHTSALNQMSVVGTVSDMAPSGVIAGKRDTLRILFDRDWQEFKDQANDIFAAVDKELEFLYNARVEAERLAKEKADKEAADKATKEEQDRAAAAKKKTDDEAAEREKDKAHRGKINRAIVQAIMKTGLTEQQAIAVVTVIAKGEVPNTKISY